MCLKTNCLNPDHFDNSWFEKALNAKKESLENKPQSVVAETYEREFKSSYNKILKQGFDNIINSLQDEAQ